MKGCVFNIERFAVHDGPGIRDLVFMKGCPLFCQWCSNPESQNPYPEISYSENRCIGHYDCGKCEKICQVGAITSLQNGKISIERELCTHCGKCIEVCPAKAIRFLGEYMTIDDVLKIIEKDGSFFWRSGGGITISGGEPLFQSDFVSELLKECQRYGIDTAIETSGYANWEDVDKVCRHANLILYDIKHMDPKIHKTFTGVSNELILENVKKLSCAFSEIPIIVRTPIIPGVNDSEENIMATVDFLAAVKGIKEYELLPYHRFGELKYRQLGKKYSLNDLKGPTNEDMTRLSSLARKARGTVNLS